MFEIGDRVRIINNIGAENYYLGKTGVIVEKDLKDETLKYRVKFYDLEDGCDCDWVNEKDLEFVNKNLHKLMKTGRVAELRNGEKYLIVRDVDSIKYGNQKWALVSNRGFRVGTSYDDSLKDNDNDSGYDVMAIYQKYDNDMTQLVTTFLDIKNKQHLVWERKEYHTVTFVEALQFGSANTYTYIDEQNLNLQQGDVVKVKTPISQYLVYINDVYNKKVTDEVLNKYDKVVKRIEK